MSPAAGGGFDDTRAATLMRRALELAALARGCTSPNPMVGAVVVAGGEIVGEGYHHRAGEAHAEVNALADAGEAARGATCYVTLEPCRHTGRTGPCTSALIDAGVARVVIGALDPNPEMAGSSVALLRDAGIDVEHGILAEQCHALNASYEHWMTTQRPLVVLKLATSLDGRIATASGASKWITGPEARRRVHALRAEVDAVMVGSGTARADDPRLNVRDAPAPGGQPARVVVDSGLTVPASARLFDDATGGPALIATTATADDPRLAAYEARGARVLSLPQQQGHVGLVALMTTLGGLSPDPVTSVLVEGGGGLGAALLEAGLVDRLHLFLAPMLLGGDGVAAIGPLGLPTPGDAGRWVVESLERVGEDVELVARPAPDRG